MWLNSVSVHKATAVHLSLRATRSLITEFNNIYILSYIRIQEGRTERNLVSSPVYPSSSVSVDVDQNQTLHCVWVCKLKAGSREHRRGWWEEHFRWKKRCSVTVWYNLTYVYTRSRALKTQRCGVHQRLWHHFKCAGLFVRPRKAGIINPACWMMLQAARCRLQTLLHLLHMFSMNLLSSVKTTEQQQQVCLLQPCLAGMDIQSRRSLD